MRSWPQSRQRSTCPPSAAVRQTGQVAQRFPLRRRQDAAVLGTKRLAVLPNHVRHFQRRPCGASVASHGLPSAAPARRRHRSGPRHAANHPRRELARSRWPDVSRGSTDRADSATAASGRCADAGTAPWWTASDGRESVARSGRRRRLRACAWRSCGAACACWPAW